MVRCRSQVKRSRLESEWIERSRGFKSHSYRQKEQHEIVTNIA